MELKTLEEIEKWLEDDNTLDDELIIKTLDLLCGLFNWGGYKILNNIDDYKILQDEGYYILKDSMFNFEYSDLLSDIICSIHGDNYFLFVKQF